MKNETDDRIENCSQVVQNLNGWIERNVTVDRKRICENRRHLYSSVSQRVRRIGNELLINIYEFSDIIIEH